jgi:tRNA(Ile)-lysidine synthetase-like protein
MEVTLERFARTMDKLFRPPYPSLVCIAVSGGVDSMALTHLATRYFQPRGVGVRALIVDHALRAESSQEAERVRALVDAMGAEARVLRMHWAPGELASSMARFELAARDKRLTLLSDACTRRGARHLLLAHTQDDQLETLLMRLTRGSSLRGLAGMRTTRAFWRTPPPQNSIASSPPLQLVKPLLECAKRDLYATCRAHGIKWVEDPTNHDATFTSRNAIRQVLKDETLLPAALHREALIETLQVFQQKREDFESEARELVRALITSGGASVDATFGRVTFQEFSGLRYARTSALALALQHLTARIAPFEGDGYTFSIFFRIAQRIKQLDLMAGQARFSAANLDWIMTSRVMQVSGKDGGLPQSTYTWKVARQKPPRWSTGELKAFRAKLSGDWTPYTLFDHRYWVRVRICGNSSLRVSDTDNNKNEPRKYMKLTELKKYQREQERRRQQEKDRLASAYRTVVIKYPNLRINDREFLDKCLPPAAPPGESEVIPATVRAQVTAKMVLVQPTVFVHKRDSVPLGFVPLARKDATGDASSDHQSSSSSARSRLVRPEEDPTNYALVGCPLLLGAAQANGSVTVALPEGGGLQLEIECRLKQVDDAVDDAVEGKGNASLRVPERQFAAAAEDTFTKQLEKHQEILKRIKF